MTNMEIINRAENIIHDEEKWRALSSSDVATISAALLIARVRERAATEANEPLTLAFDVVDTQTGEYPDLQEIVLNEDWAKGLMHCDMAGLAIEEDGNLLLIDECGNFAYAPAGRFQVIRRTSTEANDPLTLERFESICEAVHNGWWKEKINQGVTNHPDMLPYEQLAEAVKEYARATVRAALRELSSLCVRCGDCGAFQNESVDGFGACEALRRATFCEADASECRYFRRKG